MPHTAHRSTRSLLREQSYEEHAAAGRSAAAGEAETRHSRLSGRTHPAAWAALRGEAVPRAQLPRAQGLAGTFMQEDGRRLVGLHIVGATGGDHRLCPGVRGDAARLLLGLAPPAAHLLLARLQACTAITHSQRAASAAG